MVAVSGGVDSMVLLRLLMETASSHRCELAVGHFNHQLRGHASDADEAFVKQTAIGLGLRCVIGRWNQSTRARRIKQVGLEMAAREARLTFLSRIAIKLNCDTVTLAHHADDQVELFFLRLLRGAGGEGLSGMDWHGPFPSHSTITMARPLLDFSKADLLKFAKNQRIRFREDASNACLDHERNWVRHKLLLLLAARRSGFSETVRRTMEIVGTESDYIREESRGWLGSKRQKHFDRLAIALQRQVLRLQLIEQGIEASFELIEKLRNEPDTPVTISPKKTVCRDASGRVILANTQSLKFSADQRAVSLGTGGATQFGKLLVEWQVESGSGLANLSARESEMERFDAGRIGTRIVLRHWRAGDRFQPIGTRLAMKLQDLFVNQKIPAPRRRELVVATTADGEIFWVDGLRIGEHAKLRPTTRRRLVWRWQRA